MSQKLIDTNFLPRKMPSSVSWAHFPLRYVPEYSDKKALVETIDKLKNLQPLVPSGQIVKLRSELISAQEGERFVLQMGDCAETFAGINQESLQKYVNFYQELAGLLELKLGVKVLKLGRVAGQFSKPRTDEFETRGNVILPSYHGDLANQFDFNLKARKPNPTRMLQAYEKAREAMAILSELDNNIYYSHEALNLYYEDALTFNYGGQRYNSSAHSVWVGNKTNSLDFAHMHYAAEIANPIGVKIDHNMTLAKLLEICELLNPENQNGRLMLIVRMGSENINKYLPVLVGGICSAQKNLLWILDPMHGNNQYHEGIKLRNFSDIMAESVAFFEIMKQFKIKGLGLHLEASPFEVTEVLDGKILKNKQDLLQNYQTLCDPRLNRSQALEYIRNLKI